MFLNKWKKKCTPTRRNDIIYYEDSDINNILETIKQKYVNESSFVPFEISEPEDIEKNVNSFRFQMFSSILISSILHEIQIELRNVAKQHYSDFSLDVPTKCDNCFAKRNNGVCWVCAFTGDLSESGFYQKYGIMENCPFLTQKQVDDLAYDFVQNHFNLSHQEIIDDLDNDLSNKIKTRIRERFEEIWGDEAD